MDEIGCIIGIMFLTPIVILFVTLAPEVAKVVGVIIFSVLIIPALCGLLVEGVQRGYKLLKKHLTPK